MDPSYQQSMIQALMGSAYTPQSMTGQNATTPYGQAFMTGNMIKPLNPFTNPNFGYNNQSTTGMNSSNSLVNNPTTQLMQPTSTFSG